MARQIFKGGTRKGQLTIPRQTINTLPQQISNLFKYQVRAIGIPTNLYRQRQSQLARRNQTWVWDKLGNV